MTASMHADGDCKLIITLNSANNHKNYVWLEF